MEHIILLKIQSLIESKVQVFPSYLDTRVLVGPNLERPAQLLGADWAVGS
jgi:hypothetical protein